MRKWYMLFRQLTRHCVVMTTVQILAAYGPGRIHAQDLGVPDTTIPATGLTALGYAFAVNNLPVYTWGMYPTVGGRAIIRRDSLVIAVDSMTRSWVAALARGGEPHRIELFASAELRMHVDQDMQAQRYIAQWLATPGLSDADRAWILGKSVELFLGLLSYRDAKTPLPSPAHLAIARHYLMQLDALPRNVSAAPLFGVFREFMEVYLNYGMTDSAVACGMRAFALPAQTGEYRARFSMATDGGALMTFALALSAYPERYQQTMDSVVTSLRAYNAAPIPPDFAQYPWNMQYVVSRRHDFDAAIKLIQTLGRPAPTLVATHWFNQPVPQTPSDAAPEARVKPLNDGVVRLIAFGYFSCAGCQMLMKEWEQFQHQLPPGVELLVCDRTEGFWGGNLIEPAEEVEHLRHYYLDRKHYTYPIAIWAGPKESNDEGGHTPKFSPTMRAYGFYGGPHIVVVDGHGILRYRRDGPGERELLGVVTQLARERRHAETTPTRMNSAATSPVVNVP